MPKALNKGDLKDYEQALKDLEAQNYKFTTERYGSSAKIEFGRVTWLYSNGFDKTIFTLCSRVSHNVRKFMRHNELPEVPHVSTVKFNAKGILPRIGSVIKGYDMNSCYWTIAFQKGYISDKTYNYGLEDHVPKQARLIAIGSLNKTIRSQSFDGSTMSEVKMSKPHTSIIWDNIIYEVYLIYKELVHMLKDDFCMFMTDCVYFDPSRAAEVKKVFDDRELPVKTEELKLLSYQNSVLHAYNLTSGKPKKYPVRL